MILRPAEARTFSVTPRGRWMFSKPLICLFVCLLLFFRAAGVVVSRIFDGLAMDTRNIQNPAADSLCHRDLEVRTRGSWVVSQAGQGNGAPWVETIADVPAIRPTSRHQCCETAHVASPAAWSAHSSFWPCLCRRLSSMPSCGAQLPPFWKTRRSTTRISSHASWRSHCALRSARGLRATGGARRTVFTRGRPGNSACGQVTQRAAR